MKKMSGKIIRLIVCAGVIVTALVVGILTKAIDFTQMI